MKCYTCIPHCFSGDAYFFTRDIGLLCRGLQAIGVESRAVMPGQRLPDDEPDLIRVDYSCLTQPAWWRAQGVDAVFLFSWGRSRYTPIATAIKQSGAKLVIHLDHHGLIAPFLNPRGYWFSQWLVQKARYAGLAYVGFPVYRIARYLCQWFIERRRIAPLWPADVITMPSPIACRRVRRFLGHYGQPQVAQRISFMPVPVEQHFIYHGEEKQNRILAVGRWDAEVHKNPQLLIAALAKVLSGRPDWECHLVGPSSLKWAYALAEHSKAVFGGRIFASERLGRMELRNLLCSSRILVCSSRYESFHMASTEALCCGCSIVAGRLPFLPSFRLFISWQSGRVADYSEIGLANGIQGEIAAWEKNQRNARDISEHGVALFHPAQVASRLINLIANT